MTGSRLAGFVLIASLCFVPVAQAGSLIVSGAASLTNAFTEVKTVFEKKHPDIKVTTNFAASGPLLKQIEEGAPVDVFASADQKTMDMAAEKKLLLEASRVNFAANSLVLVAPAADAPAFARVEDLTAKGVERIAIGNPESVPAGRYAKEALTLKGLWEPLQPKFILAESVRQVLDYVVRGEVQAGFVYRTDALQAGDKARLVETVAGKTPVTYPISIIAASANIPDARVFIDFVRSQEGAAILEKYGFSKP
ncbi:MAG: molybdate ABC transporter substrate-binding protein [Desulfovibrio sp.]|jgi:molybdate transport system substrate-binding protein|nr:molybdate ABC transporter substrate-binding protein [Desulfovibrio sp.]